MKRFAFWKNPQWRYGSLSTVLLAALLAVLVLINLAVSSLETRYGWRKDYSFNRLTTQSETTTALLAGLTQDVHIYALFRQGEEDAPLLELLNRYAALSPRVTWEQADVTLNPGLVTRFKGDMDNALANDSLVVYCQDTDRYKLLDPASFISLDFNSEEGVYQIGGVTYEKQITEAIAYVTRAEIPRAVLLQGHGELDSGGTAVLAAFLESNNYQVTYFSLGGEEKLAKGDVLFLLSPQKDLLDAELREITAFLQEGGGLFITCDFTDDLTAMPNYQALLRSYGFVPLEGVVVASEQEPDTYYDDKPLYLLPYMLSTDVTATLAAGGMDRLLLAGARALETPEDTGNSLRVSTVLTSGYKAYLRKLTAENMTIVQQDDDPLGPFALALLARRAESSGNISRALIIGNSTCVTDSSIYAMTNISEFLLQAAEHLAQAKPVSLDIMAKIVRPALSTDSQTLGVVLVALLPLLTAAAALMVLLPRRHR